MTDKSMQFLYGDRELLLLVGDLLSLPVDVIVHDTDPKLLLAEPIGQRILSEAGTDIQLELKQLIRQYGSIEPGMVVFTTAGSLPFQSIIHCINPNQQDDGQAVLEQTILRSLLLCETNDWQSIAFPAIGVESRSITLDMCAQAFFRAITSFWDARHECVVEKIILSVKREQLPIFFSAFRQHAIQSDEQETKHQDRSADQDNMNIGVVDLLEDDLAEEDEEVKSWFK